jgi:hypothetical protein
MPLEYFYREPENVLCVKVKVPIVLAEEDISVLVDNITHLPEMARKVDHIDARLKDFNVRPLFVHEDGNNWISVIEEEGWERFGWNHREGRLPVVKKILIEGTLHKQIYYVNKDNDVRHFGEDIPFSDDITLADPAPVVDEDDVFGQIWEKKIDMRWSLRGGSRLAQTGEMTFRVKIVEERQIWVQACPRMDAVCVKGRNILKDGGFEQWGSPTDPLFWGATNVFRYGDNPYNGSYAAEMGGTADIATETGTLEAALFQTVDIVPDQEYRLCFYVREDAYGGLGAFNLLAELVFFDGQGNEIISRKEDLLPTQIPDDNYRRFCIDAAAPIDASTAVVRFTFTPTSPDNASTVKLDNVTLECIRAGLYGTYYEERR